MESTSRAVMLVADLEQSRSCGSLSVLLKLAVGLAVHVSFSNMQRLWRGNRRGYTNYRLAAGDVAR